MTLFASGMVNYDWLDVDVFTVACPPLKIKEKTASVLTRCMGLAMLTILIGSVLNLILWAMKFKTHNSPQQ